MVGIPKGAVNDCICRTGRAMMKLPNVVITWRSIPERKELSKGIQTKHGFVNCAGLTAST